MKTLKGILEQSKMYATPDTERFVAKHVVSVKKPSKAEEDDNLFKAANIKSVDRETQHGFNAGSDAAVYEDQQVDEKTLTPAEMKKREEVAKAIERENPNMPMGKKMAIATSTAKKVAEEVEQLEEGDVSHGQYMQYHGEAKKMLDKISKGLDVHAKNITDKNNYNGGQAHWGHVGDMKQFHRQIQDLHDMVLQHGEYAAPPKVMKESLDQDVILTEEVGAVIDSLFEEMNDQEREEFLQMMESDEGAMEIIDMISQALAEEQ
jgi:hypothetical protein